MAKTIFLFKYKILESNGINTKISPAAQFPLLFKNRNELIDKGERSLIEKIVISTIFMGWNGTYYFKWSFLTIKLSFLTEDWLDYSQIWPFQMVSPISTHKNSQNFYECCSGCDHPLSEFCYFLRGIAKHCELSAYGAFVLFIFTKFVQKVLKCNIC